MQARLLKAFKLGQRRFDHPLAKNDFEGGSVQQRQKGAWGQQAAFGVLPACQGLRAHHLSGLHDHLGLQKQHELRLRERFAQEQALLMVFALGALLRCVELVKPVATRLFGGIHGLVGVAQQGVGVRVVTGEHRVANAGRYRHALGVQGVGRRNAFHHAPQ